MVGGGDGSGSTLVLANRPVLSESGSSSDRRLVGPRVGAEGVVRAIRSHGTELRHAGRARVKAAVGLDDVVLRLGAVDPAVDGKVRAAAARLVIARVFDGSVVR